MLKPVELTDKAIKEVKEIMDNKGIPADYGLRIGMKGGGCGGVSYVLGFDKLKETDLNYEVGGIPVYVEKKHAMYLVGLQVDFYEDAESRGFMFVNPNKPAEKPAQ